MPSRPGRLPRLPDARTAPKPLAMAPTFPPTPISLSMSAPTRPLAPPTRTVEPALPRPCGRAIWLSSTNRQRLAVVLPIGFLNLAIYPIYSSDSYTTAFHDHRRRFQRLSRHHRLRSRHRHRHSQWQRPDRCSYRRTHLNRGLCPRFGQLRTAGHHHRYRHCRRIEQHSHRLGELPRWKHEYRHFHPQRNWSGNVDHVQPGRGHALDYRDLRRRRRFQWFHVHRLHSEHR